MDDLYRDYILEHYKRPRNFGELEPHDLEALEHNPLCGDELGVHIRVKDGRIEDLRFHGHGCAISQAAASIASEELKGMELEEVGELGADWMLELLGHPRLGDAAQVRAAEPEGRARRGHRRPRLARLTHGALPSARRSTPRDGAIQFLPQSTGFASDTRQRGASWPRLTAPRSPSPARSSRTSRASCALARASRARSCSELSKIKGEPDWMAEKRLQVAGDLRTQADADVGPRPRAA